MDKRLSNSLTPNKPPSVTGPGCNARCTVAAILVPVVLGCSLIKPAPESYSPRIGGKRVLLEALAAADITPGDFRQRSTADVPAGADTDADGRRQASPSGESDPGQILSITLHDGTVAGGLFFEYTGPQTGSIPLLMAGFGFLQDRWAAAANRFYRNYVADRQRRLPAHVLILDHPSSGPFLAANGVLSIGSYDDARMWVEVARHFKHRLGVGPVHLLGIGSSGQTVVHALVEDRRQESRLFRSGIALSIAPDLKQVPGRQLAQLATPGNIANPWQSGRVPGGQASSTDAALAAAMVERIENDFIAGYRRINPDHTSFTIPVTTIPTFFYQAFDNRLAVLRRQPHSHEAWPRRFSLANLDAYMRSTRIVEVIGDVQTPLLLLSARDDPYVSHRQFQAVRKAAGRNPWVICYETASGNHGEYDRVYGRNYLGRILQLMMDPQILATWHTESHFRDNAQ